MRTNQISKLRRLAVVAVLSNLAVIALLAWSLPREAQVLLPVAALILPLLTAAVLDSAKAEVQDERSAKPRVARELHTLHRPLDQAA